jgi:hypothetical protein
VTPPVAPEWLAVLQSRFGAVLRRPLGRDTGILTARLEDYPTDALAEVCDARNASAAERLAVYNRQYWFRLFTVLQTAWPLTTRLLGPWRINAHAERFFLSHPPRHWDLDRVLDGFDTFLAETLEPCDERPLYLEAAHLDALRRALFRAPAVTPFVPSAADAARLLDARLLRSPAVALFRETFSLVDIDLDDPDSHPPKALSTPRWWALHREPSGIRYVALAPLEGELLHLLTEHTVREALGHLEARCTEAERATLPAHTQHWLARSVARGTWVGLEALQRPSGSTQV